MTLLSSETPSSSIEASAVESAAQSSKPSVTRKPIKPSGLNAGLSADTDAHPYENVFVDLLAAIAQQLNHQNNSAETHFSASLAGESSQFTRFNGSKVRQSGHVCDGQLQITLISAERTATAKVPFVGEFETDWTTAQSAIAQLQAELPHLPVDPYIVVPVASSRCQNQGQDQGSDQGQGQSQGQSREVRSSQLLSAEAIANTLLAPVQALDFSGLYAGGLAYRAYGDSAGNRHWFEAPSFTLDYSLFGVSPNQAVKGTLAGHEWNPDEYAQAIEKTQQQLALLARPAKAIPKGCYRTYLAPAAVGDMIETLIWGGGLGEADLRQGNSALGKLERGELSLSAQFSLSENFERAGVPRFNSLGEAAPAQLPIIQQGQWINSLVSSRSAKEYGKASNAANAGETMRAPVVDPGQLREQDILRELGTGLYLSNLHYLNWSDLTAGRITGMTRYACFWVEDGEIVAPIENLRFDDDLYRFLGEGLLGLTQAQTFLPAVGTYDRRSLGGMWMPGMLIDQFRYTL